MDDLTLPNFTSAIWGIGAFLFLALVLHVLLIWYFPLTKLGWKKADYVWLIFALLGALGSFGGARQTIAQTLISTAETRLQSQADAVRSAIRFGTSVAVCRQFERSEYSAPQEQFDRVQREFDAVCAWFKRAAAQLESTPPDWSTPLTLSYFGGPIPNGADEYAAKQLNEAIRSQNAAASKAAMLRQAGQRSEWDIGVAALGPALGIIALALRLTKVTGEILLERHGARADKRAARDAAV